ncbi:MAG TPA: aldolase/citrate lyase family protein [Kofleriaceae bacterium]|nr:aldolase/citrate lyase family protein [Kofleriaceae bacterium]
MNHGLGCWLACPDIVFIELARDVGFGTLVMDAEHGTFSLADLDKLIPFATSIGMRVLVKVEGPNAEPIQQALDFGADGVIIPHILGAEHARLVCAASKYPTLGTRSSAGARPVRYATPRDTYFDDDNRRTACYPMVESKEAFAAIDDILALPTVDGVFVGTSDLSLSSGRGRYRFDDADRAAIERISQSAKRAGKPWLMPAWRSDEQAYVKGLEPAVTVVIEQQGAMRAGLMQAYSAVSP